ncbi:hypothetical protein BH09ACT8_BH09ACT8_01830 [soil metagenome]
MSTPSRSPTRPRRSKTSARAKPFDAHGAGRILHLFSLITGTQVPEDGDRTGICVVAWTQGAVATGMLTAGTTALFGGLGWMPAGHAVNKVPLEDPNDAAPDSFLAVLGGWLTFAAAMTTTLILSETAIDYLHFMYARRPET